ncbi:MAG: hypothetical protein ABIO49_05965 [Dokdonella sp.]
MKMSDPLAIPNPSSVPIVLGAFDERGRMRDSPLYLRVVGVCGELAKFTG